MGWTTVFPKEGIWFHINNLSCVADLCIYLVENYSTKKIVILIINGKDLRKVAIRTRAKAEWFRVYARNNCGTGYMKVRVLEK